MVDNGLAHLRILVAEDESLIALDLETILNQLGCEVIGPVAEVEDIARMAESQHIDGALVDVNLRGKQVFSVLPLLISRGIPVVLTSGYDDPTFFPEAYRQLPRVTKPFDLKAIYKVCRQTMVLC